MSKIEVNQISSQCGSTLTIGQSGDTVTLACGATAAGFGSTGEVSWDTTKKTTGFTAVSGVGYFCDTTSAGFTVTLPATPSAGNVVAVSDYTGTFSTNNITIGRNGSNINGSASDFSLGKNNTTAQFIYVDATEGWRTVFTGSISDLQETYITATGGTITTCGNCKIHTFTGPGTFCVSQIAETDANNQVSYIVVAGGASGGASFRSGGGGAGGFREDKSPTTCYTASPLDGAGDITVTATAYPITVGAGGAATPVPAATKGNSGSNSVFSTITSTGGGGAGSNVSPFGPDRVIGNPGGSGGGGAANTGVPTAPGGTGNSPPTSPAQGTNGGTAIWSGPTPGGSGGGGGGATVAGTNGSSSNNGGPGGNGATTSISGSSTAYAGGGGGGANTGGTAGSGGTGGGGAGGSGSSPYTATAGTTNTGGGGGGAGASSCAGGAAGGSGIVIIRYRYQ